MLMVWILKGVKCGRLQDVCGMLICEKKKMNPWRYVGDVLALKETITRNWKVDLKIPFENVASYRIC